MATHTLPRPGVNATGYPAASLILNIADRSAIEAAVEHLLAILDAQDGDPDLEPEEDRCTANDDYGTDRQPPGVWFLTGPGSEEDAEPEDNLFGGGAVPLAAFGNPITATFRNPQGQVGRFVGVGR